MTWSRRGPARRAAHGLSSTAVVGLVLASGILVLILVVSAFAPLHLPDQSPGRPPLVDPQPQLQQAPATDLARLRSRARKQLEAYAWVDRATGRVRIPIDVAMRELARRQGEHP